MKKKLIESHKLIASVDQDRIWTENANCSHLPHVPARLAGVREMEHNAYYIPEHKIICNSHTFLLTIICHFLSIWKMIFWLANQNQFQSTSFHGDKLWIFSWLKHFYFLCHVAHFLGMHWKHILYILLLSNSGFFYSNILCLWPLLISWGRQKI